MKSSNFTRKIKSILEDNRNERVIGKQKKGKISSKDLYRHQITEKVFKTKKAKGEKEYYFTFYLDISGSMASKETTRERVVIERFTAMSNALEELNDTFFNIKGINVRLIAFSSNTLPLLIKDYHETIKKGDIAKILNAIFNSDFLLFWWRKAELEKTKFDEVYDSWGESLKGVQCDCDTILELQKGLKIKDHKIWYEGSKNMEQEMLARLRESTSSTNLLPAIDKFPPTREKEISFVFSDGQFDDNKTQLKRKISHLKGQKIGIGILHTLIYETFSFRNGAYIETIDDVKNVIIRKLRKFIKR